VAARVVPVYILEEEITGSTGAGPANRMFLLRSVISLKRNLETLGYGLVLRRGKPEEELPRMCRETGATAVYCNQEYEPEARRWVSALASVSNAVVHRPWEETGLLRSCGYAERIVIYEEQRPKCLSMFRAVKD
jgi:deoxyribodipyrimidine photolyase